MKAGGISPERRKQLDEMEKAIERERVELENLKQGEGIGIQTQTRIQVPNNEASYQEESTLAPH